MKRWSKVLISILIVLALAVCAAGCGKPENNVVHDPANNSVGIPLSLTTPDPGAALLGEWYCTHDGVPVCLNLAEDGVYTLTISGSETSGSWEMVDGSLALDGNTESVMAVIDYERIIWSEAGEVFLREEPIAWQPVQVATENVEIDMFDGYWISYYVETGGTRLPSNVLGDNTEFLIDNGRVAMGGSVFGDIVCDFTFKDSALIYKDDDALITLQLQGDLNLRCTFKDDQTELIIYMIQGDLSSLPAFTEQENGE